jgi:hypothetical protein
MEQEPIKSEENKRRHYSAEEIAAHVSGYEQSGVSQREYAQREGLPVSSLGNWVNRKQKRVAAAQWVEVEKPGALPGGDFTGYVMGFGGGMELRVPRGFAVAEVAALAKILREAK